MTRVYVQGAAVYEYGNPTPAEQAHLEAVNRARANPLAEASRLGIDLFEDVAPGAISGDLVIVGANGDDDDDGGPSGSANIIKRKPVFLRFSDRFTRGRGRQASPRTRLGKAVDRTPACAFHYSAMAFRAWLTRASIRNKQGLAPTSVGGPGRSRWISIGRSSGDFFYI